MSEVAHPRREAGRGCLLTPPGGIPIKHGTLRRKLIGLTTPNVRNSSP